MPASLFSRVLKTEPRQVASKQDLVAFFIEGDHFGAHYVETRVLDNGEVLPLKNIPVDRSISAVGAELSDLIAKLVTQTEIYRQADEDQRAADKDAADAEAVRWAGLTPEQKLSERDAKLAALQAADDAAFVADRR